MAVLPNYLFYRLLSKNTERRKVFSRRFIPPNGSQRFPSGFIPLEAIRSKGLRIRPDNVCGKRVIVALRHRNPGRSPRHELTMVGIVVVPGSALRAQVPALRALDAPHQAPNRSRQASRKDFRTNPVRPIHFAEPSRHARLNLGDFLLHRRDGNLPLRKKYVVDQRVRHHIHQFAKERRRRRCTHAVETPARRIAPILGAVRWGDTTKTAQTS